LEVDPSTIPLGSGGSAARGGASATGGSAGIASGGSAAGSNAQGGLSGGGVNYKDVGKPCESSDDCKGSLTCHYDTKDYIGHLQCTQDCASSDECSESFGQGSFCIGANICVRACVTDADCDTGTICNEQRWCERTGSKPKCVGVATACSLRTAGYCLSTFGCSWSSSCTGSPWSCSSFYTSVTCQEQGCTWSSSSKHCSGTPTPCILKATQLSCFDVSGCEWESTCSGIPTSCTAIAASLCDLQTGCYLDD
jgi:hypothetical protein